MKKIIAVLVIFVCVGTALSAQINMSAGAGALLDMSFRNGISAKEGDDKMYWGNRNISFGGYGFFDATYAEVDVSFAYGSLTGIAKGKSTGGTNVDTTEDGGSVMQLGISLLGKYPIDIGPLTVFPLVGIGYNIVLSSKDKDGKKVEFKDSSAMKELSQFAILAGGGLDFDINSNIYLRGSVLLQARFASKSQKDGVDAMKTFVGSGAKVNSTLGFGPVIKVAAGYRF